MQETSEKSVAMYGVVPASKIIGESVVNRQGENVGKIQELLIDANKNRVAYAVLSFGGFLGMGNKLFAMPWEAFEFSVTEKKLILNVDKEKLQTAPGSRRAISGPISRTHSGERASTTTTTTSPPGSRRIDDSGRLLDQSSGSTAPLPRPKAIVDYDSGPETIPIIASRYGARSGIRRTGVPEAIRNDF